MQDKRLILIFFNLFFLLAVIFLSIILLVDPLRLYHKPYFCKNEIFDNMRLSVAGLIKEYDFDSVILGTSMLENTSSKEAEQIFGGKFANLSLQDGSFFERDLILNYIFKYKNLKTVIFSLDAEKIINQVKVVEHYDLDNYGFLYDDNPFNDIKAYLNDKMLFKIFKFGFGCKNSDFDRPTAWLRDKEKMARFDGFENWFKDKKYREIAWHFRKIKEAGISIETGQIQDLDDLEERIFKSKNYIDIHLLKFIKNYPNINFILIIPTYSRLFDSMGIKTKPSDFFTAKEAMRYLVKQSQKYKNMKIYGWSDTDYPDDIANYRDLIHYRPELNSLMLKNIRDNVGLLTPLNFDEYYEKIEKKSLNFDFMPYYKQVLKNYKD